ncbi:ribbon-helix-helix protein, CopG family [Janthinobacterium psychrotolerans]|uniref:ribbon-helix-helix protein, CopG family n=1 Tax=Janthinobacterium psychrotolerans TaxID=1747903 RepID=UPI0009F2418C|nr:ribbon-helix-helix protein, CopG family [Janthinobacterium psychrotolerans]
MKNQKAKAKAKSMAAVHVRLGVDLVEELDALAAGAGKTRAELIRDALAGHCQASKTSEQAEQRHAAIVQILEEQERRRISEKLQRDEDSATIYQAIEGLADLLGIERQQEPKR